MARREDLFEGVLEETRVCTACGLARVSRMRWFCTIRFSFPEHPWDWNSYLMLLITILEYIEYVFFTFHILCTPGWLYIKVINGANVCDYSNPMDGLGLFFRRRDGGFFPSKMKPNTRAYTWSVWGGGMSCGWELELRIR